MRVFLNMADRAAVPFNIVNNGTLVIGDNTNVNFGDNTKVNVFTNPTATSSHTSGLNGETARERLHMGFELTSEQYLPNENTLEDGVQISTDLRARQYFNSQKRKKESLVDHVSDSLRNKKK